MRTAHVQTPRSRSSRGPRPDRRRTWPNPLCKSIAFVQSIGVASVSVVPVPSGSYAPDAMFSEHVDPARRRGRVRAEHERPGEAMRFDRDPACGRRSRQARTASAPTSTCDGDAPVLDRQRVVGATDAKEARLGIVGLCLIEVEPEADQYGPEHVGGRIAVQVDVDDLPSELELQPALECVENVEPVDVTADGERQRIGDREVAAAADRCNDLCEVDREDELQVRERCGEVRARRREIAEAGVAQVDVPGEDAAAEGETELIEIHVQCRRHQADDVLQRDLRRAVRERLHDVLVERVDDRDDLVEPLLDLRRDRPVELLGERTHLLEQRRQLFDACLEEVADPAAQRDGRAPGSQMSAQLTAIDAPPRSNGSSIPGSSALAARSAVTETGRARCGDSRCGGDPSVREVGEAERSPGACRDRSRRAHSARLTAPSSSVTPRKPSRPSPFERSRRPGCCRTRPRDRCPFVSRKKLPIASTPNVMFRWTST